jgi:hypothetical protein
MTWAFIGFASAVFVGCVKHDDSTFPNSPPPASPSSTARSIVDSGPVSLLMDAEGTGGGGIGSFTPDARLLPDSTGDLASPDLPGLGISCEPVVGSGCSGTYACFVSAATGAATCQDATDRIFIAGVTCNPNSSLCRPGLFCASGICVALCHVNMPQECSRNGICHLIGPAESQFGYCAEQ